MIAFNNRRTLHARTTFDPSSGLRHLRGCYVDNDDLLSRIRVLERGPART
jgi:gamma-butyrobetaine dioxygenase